MPSGSSEAEAWRRKPRGRVEFALLVILLMWASHSRVSLRQTPRYGVDETVSGRLGLLPVRPPPVRPLTRSAPYPFGPLITMLPLACQLLSQRRQSVTRSPPYRVTYSYTIGLLLLH